MFSISFCLYRACFTHLISSNLSCNLCLWYYDQLVHFDKEINANVYRHSLWEYSKTFHCSFEWHLTPVLGRHPVLSGHNSIPWRCLLNTGFTVCWPLQIFFHQILSPGDYMGIILLFISFIRYYWLHSLLYKN